MKILWEASGVTDKHWGPRDRDVQTTIRFRNVPLYVKKLQYTGQDLLIDVIGRFPLEGKFKLIVVADEDAQ